MFGFFSSSAVDPLSPPQGHPKLSSELASKVNVPKDYVVKREDKSENGDLIINVIGCAGSGNADQIKVVEFMQTKGRRPHFRIHAGDTIYPNGCENEFDSNFKRLCHDMYGNTEPGFYALGNHDHGWPEDWKRALAQINHTFVEDEKISPKRKELFQKKELKLKELGPFNMPGAYYSLYFPENNLLVCVSDSIHFVEACLNYWLGDDDPNNQAAWLIRIICTYPDATKLDVSHNPFESFDRRFFHSKDAKDYLSEAQLDVLDKRFKIKGKYHELVFQCTRRLEAEAELILKRPIKKLIAVVAHEHGLKYSCSNEPGRELCQLSSAGGGGVRLENRFKFTNPDELGVYLKRFGFAQIIAAPNGDLIFELFTTTGQHFRFDTKSAVPIRRAPDEESPALVLFRTAVMGACKTYFKNSEEASKGIASMAMSAISHRALGSNRAQDFDSYFKDYESRNFREAAPFVIGEIGTRSTPLRAGSLEFLLAQTLEEYSGLTYAEFVKLYDKHLEKLELHFNTCCQFKDELQQTRIEKIRELSAPLKSILAEEAKVEAEARSGTVSFIGSVVSTTAWSAASAARVSLSGWLSRPLVPAVSQSDNHSGGMVRSVSCIGSVPQHPSDVVLHSPRRRSLSRTLSSDGH
jgi:hypothetical protein